MRVLVVEDEVNLGSAIKELLEEQKYYVDYTDNGDDAIMYATYQEYDVVILDVMIPGKNGFEVVKELRQLHNQVPILMLTAKDDIQDKIFGLDSGADDYMTKPFISEELLARVRALSRRHGELVLDQLSFEDLVFDLSNHKLSCKEKSIHLGFKEAEVMKVLMSNLNMIISKDTLIAKVWGNDSEVEENNVEAYISFLRKKLIYLESIVHIENIRKVGYRLEKSYAL